MQKAVAILRINDNTNVKFHNAYFFYMCGTLTDKCTLKEPHSLKELKITFLL